MQDPISLPLDLDHPEHTRRSRAQMADTTKDEADEHLSTEELGAYAKGVVKKLAAFPREWVEDSGKLIMAKEPKDPSALVALVAELRSLHKSASQASSF